MINGINELSLQKSSEEMAILTANLKQMSIDSIARQAALAAEENVNKEDPAEAIVKAYLEMDKTMMKVMDEHIERVRKSSERNRELFKKQALKNEIEKREEMRKELFDEAAEKVDEQRKLLLVKG